MHDSDEFDEDFDDDWSETQDDESDGYGTIDCPECGAEIFDDIDVCPRCGHAIIHDTSVWAGKSTWWIVLGILGILAVIASLTWVPF